MRATARGVREILLVVAVEVGVVLGLVLVGEVSVRTFLPEYRMLAQSRTTTGGHPLDLNSAGFRDVEHAVVKPAGVQRIVVIGDSIAWGYSVAMDASVSRVLEQLLNQSPGARYEVVNVSGVGRDPGLYLPQMDGIIRYEPDVLLYLMCLNDVGDTYVRLRGGSRQRAAEAEAQKSGAPRSLTDRVRDVTGGWRWMLRRSALYSLLDSELTLWLYRHGYLAMDPTRPGFIELLAGFGVVSWSDEAWGLFLDDLERLGSALARRNVRFMVAEFPYRFLLDGPRENRWSVRVDRFSIDPFERVREHARAHDVAYVDLRAAYNQALREREQTGERYLALFGPLDFVHPSEYGHRVAALAIMRAVKRVEAGRNTRPAFHRTTEVGVG